MKRLFLIILLLIIGQITSFAQEIEEVDKWDNQLFLGNKVAWGKNSWRYSGELQVRLNDNMQGLSEWYVEGVATYMQSENWEFTPDYRFSIKPDRVESRFGGATVFKKLWEKSQLVHQVKGQIDMIHGGESTYGARYAIFYNKKISDKILATSIAGIFYRWSNEFTGLQFARAGLGLSYIFDVAHSLNFSYFVGATDTGNEWTFQGIPTVQFIININKEYKYLPAKYFDF